MDDATRPPRRWTRRSVLKTLGLAGAGVAGLSVTPEILTGQAVAQTTAQFTTEDVTIESFDGTEIAATLYLPQAAGPHPSVLMTHGWGGNRGSLTALASQYVTNGFAALAYDSRGFGESGGQVTSTGPNEVDDARTLISWLGDHDAVATDADGDPLVGMDGSSYGGGIQLRTAAVDDRLDAIVPRITWHSLPEAYGPNGVLKVLWANVLSAAGQSGSLAPELVELGEQIEAQGEVTEDFQEFYRSRSPVSYLHEIDTPTLLVHSWYDRLFPPDQAIANFQGLHRRGVEAGLVMQNGSGHHLGDAPAATEAEQAYVANATLSWMGAHVGDDGDTGIPTVSLYDDSTDSFITADRFPPSDVGTRRYALDAAGKVTLGGGESGGGSDGGSSGDGSSQTVATFDFDIDERTEILGSAELEATVIPRGEGTVHLFAALQRVTDDGASVIKDQITPVAIDRSTRLDLDLFPVHAVLSAGETLRLALATQDQAIDDVLTPPLSPSGLYVDGDEGTSATLVGARGRGARLTVPIRGEPRHPGKGWGRKRGRGRKDDRGRDRGRGPDR